MKVEKIVQLHESSGVYVWEEGRGGVCFGGGGGRGHPLADSWFGV